MTFTSQLRQTGLTSYHLPDQACPTDSPMPAYGTAGLCGFLDMVHNPTRRFPTQAHRTTNCVKSVSCVTSKSLVADKSKCS